MFIKIYCLIGRLEAIALWFISLLGSFVLDKDAHLRSRRLQRDPMLGEVPDSMSCAVHQVGWFEAEGSQHVDNNMKVPTWPA